MLALAAHVSAVAKDGPIFCADSEFEILKNENCILSRLYKFFALKFTNNLKVKECLHRARCFFNRHVVNQC